ncbi:hypothetical protein [Brevibacillus agri]|uniref:hypothetical protein n=1 Tax=Brevibacillus agri TaxID=51101 RepID=UPI001EE57AFC|nr:hypothetical protein [Brevibacillus agri]MCG5252607.1 hypothetical protein [Brevibacillus agri]
MAENPRESDGYLAKMYEGECVIPAREIGSITAKVTIDVSDALTGLKALRREADAAVRALKELECVKDAVNERFIRDVAKEYGVNVIRIERTGHNTVTVVTDSDRGVVEPFIERLGIERRAGIHDVYRARIESDDGLPLRPEITE